MAVTTGDLLPFLAMNPRILCGPNLLIIAKIRERIDKRRRAGFEGHFKVGYVKSSRGPSIRRRITRATVDLLASAKFAVSVIIVIALACVIGT